MENCFRMMRIVIAVLAMTGSADAGPRWLNDKDLTYVFGGRELAGFYENGAGFTEIYRLNGKVEYQDQLTKVAGSWSVKSGTFCTQYVNGDGGCFKVTMLGENCFEFWLIDAGTSAVADKWIARSSNVKYPSTCPK